MGACVDDDDDSGSFVVYSFARGCTLAVGQIQAAASAPSSGAAYAGRRQSDTGGRASPVVSAVVDPVFGERFWVPTRLEPAGPDGCSAPACASPRRAACASLADAPQVLVSCTVIRCMRGQRLHHLDLLRAAAMLLGIVYHALLAAPALGRALPPASAWESSVCVWLVSTIHAFRLPLFFLLAGFFAALVVGRGGVRAFVEGRARRIGVPLVIGVLTLAPAVDLTRAAASHDGLYSFGFDPRPIHLWFLWYLLLFYAVVLVARRGTGSLGERVAAAVRAAVARPAGRAALVALTALFLLRVPVFETDPQYSFAPREGVFVYYLGFFALGWILLARPDVLHGLGGRWRAQLAVAFTASIVLSSLPHDHVGRPASALILAVVAWTAIGGLIGAARELASTPSPRIRYLADASYWLYLVHLPLVLALHLAVAPLDLGLALTAVVAVAGASAVGLVTYDRLVRYGAIGRLLHGHREPPVRVAEAVAQATAVRRRGPARAG